jgi:hypothetical protein
VLHPATNKLAASAAVHGEITNVRKRIPDLMGILDLG